jgi:hypothetical protein
MANWWLRRKLAEHPPRDYVPVPPDLVPPRSWAPAIPLASCWLAVQWMVRPLLLREPVLFGERVYWKHNDGTGRALYDLQDVLEWTGIAREQWDALITSTLVVNKKSWSGGTLQELARQTGVPEPHHTDKVHGVYLYLLARYILELPGFPPA